MTLKTRIYLLCSFLLVGCNQPKEKVETQMTEINNPILPGYFADPSLVQYEGKFYLYATVDPWGSGFSAVLGFRGFPELDVSSVELAYESGLYICSLP